MPTFKGFNTIDQPKKFGMVDFELIKRDLLNAFSIRNGEIVGLPELGTNIWGFIFEQNDDITSRQVEAEVRRVIAFETRVEIVTINLSSSHNTVIVEVRLQTVNNSDAETLFLVFDQDTQTVTAK